MCGRYTLANTDKIKERFNAKNDLKLFRPSYNIAPSVNVPTITRSSPNKIVMMNWGFKWKKEGGPGPINLRKDSFKDKPFFKHFLLKKRCIIPADGFFEWGMLKLEEKEEKFPFYFYLEDRKLFGFAGVYNEFESGNTRDYFAAIITTEPNEKVKKVHGRMPAILREEDEDAWLDPQNKEFEVLYKMIGPYKGKDMKFHPVSKAVNNPANNRQDLLKEIKVSNHD